MKNRVEKWLRCGGKEKINFESFVKEGIAAKAMGLSRMREREREREREKVKREQYGKECSKEIRQLLEVKGR